VCLLLECDAIHLRKSRCPIPIPIISRHNEHACCSPLLADVQAGLALVVIATAAACQRLAGDHNLSTSDAEAVAALGSLF
jgi:hypothetical protein